MTNTPWEMERWENLTAVWAGLTKYPNFGQCNHALIALGDALEPPDEIEEAGNRSFLVQTACIWLIYNLRDGNARSGSGRSRVCRTLEMSTVEMRLRAWWRKHCW